MQEAYSKEEFETKLRDMGNRMYHIHHPFHIKNVYEGTCTKKRFKGWVANRFYYQCMILLKMLLLCQIVIV